MKLPFWTGGSAMGVDGERYFSCRVIIPTSSGPLKWFRAKRGTLALYKQHFDLAGSRIETESVRQVIRAKSTVNAITLSGKVTFKVESPLGDHLGDATLALLVAEALKVGSQWDDHRVRRISSDIQRVLKLYQAGFALVLLLFFLQAVLAYFLISIFSVIFFLGGMACLFVALAPGFVAKRLTRKLLPESG
jgi:hypothetical protein